MHYGRQSTMSWLAGLAREEEAAKSAMMAQFGKEVSDDDGRGDQAGDGRRAKEGV